MKKRYEIIIEALQYYREQVLSDKVIDASMADISDKPWSKQEIMSLLHEYSDIDRIIQKIKEADEYTKKTGTADTDNDISVDKYNILYFTLRDILS